MVEEPRKIKKSIIREDFLELTNDLTAAVILNQLLYWTDTFHHVDKILAEFKAKQSEDEKPIPLTQGWIYKSNTDLAQETMLQCSRETIRRGINLLLNKEFILSRANPDVKWDKTTQYKVDLLKVHQALQQKNYSGLEGYKFSAQLLSIAHCVQSIAQIVQSDVEICACNNRDYNRKCSSKEEHISVSDETLNHTNALIKTSAVPKLNVPEDHMTSLVAIMDMWNEKKIRQHKNPTNKTYLASLKCLHGFMTGKSPYLNGSCPKEYEQYRGKTFHRRDFNKAITQFALAATNTMYYPPVGKNKNWLKKQSLKDFMWNDRAQQSLFLEYLEHDAVLLSEKYLKDDNPDLTLAIMEEFYNNQPNLKKEEANHATFIKASNKLHAFYEEISPRINGHLIPTTKKLAKWLVDLVFASNQGKEVHPYYLLAKHVYTETLPLFLINQNVVKGKQKKEEPVNYKTWVE